MALDSKHLTNAVKQLLAELGDDINREGLEKTPERAAKAYSEILNGYKRSLESEITVFKNTHNYDDVVYSGRINFFSICEHHLLPFYGTAHVAYIPDKTIIGLSKLSRAIDIYARRLQDQERITMQAANELEKLLSPKGIAVMLEGQHLCNMARGIKQFNSTMTTMTFKGEFKTDSSLRDRFLKISSK